jgi:hypothetical protein
MTEPQNSKPQFAPKDALIVAAARGAKLARLALTELVPPF